MGKYFWMLFENLDSENLVINVNKQNFIIKPNSKFVIRIDMHYFDIVSGGNCFNMQHIC